MKSEVNLHPEYFAEFSSLVDGSAEEFTEHLKDKNVGYVQSLYNTLAGTFQSFVAMRNDLVAKIKSEKLDENSEEVKILQGVYVELMKIEQKALICNEWVKEHSIN